MKRSEQDVREISVKVLGKSKGIEGIQAVRSRVIVNIALKSTA